MGFFVMPIAMLHVYHAQLTVHVLMYIINFVVPFLLRYNALFVDCTSSNYCTCMYNLLSQLMPILWHMCTISIAHTWLYGQFWSAFLIVSINSYMSEVRIHAFVCKISTNLYQWHQQEDVVIQQLLQLQSRIRMQANFINISCLFHILSLVS